MKSSDTWLGEASRFLAIAGRMGSTSPMPMKANTAARAVAHTALGCLSSEAFSASRVTSRCRQGVGGLAVHGGTPK